MAIGSTIENDNPPKRRTRRRKTAHLKRVPDSKALREQIRAKCEEIASQLDKSRPLSKDEMESIVRAMLVEMDQPEGYVGWAMVMMASSFWRDQVAAVPPSRRLFLLPHCLKHAAGCPADYDEYGLDCKTCGACSIADFRGLAEDMGYKVLVAEGSPIVLKIIVSGYVDAVVGVACLNVLEKAIDKILLAGIPCMAVPLLSSDCRNTSVDENWVDDMIRVPHVEQVAPTKSYLHLMRGSAGMFEANELDRLVPRARGGKRLVEMNGKGIGGLEPIAGTEAIAYDFLGKGGKYSRPFITLAAYDALKGGEATSGQGEQVISELSDSVKRAAMSIEAFHKASLVHDDVEDNDEFRYGDEAMHRKYGVPTAINVGDYLVGLGYRLVSRESKELGAETVADIVDLLADAHQRLSEGQGAELLWRDAKSKRLTPLDALKIYALKTAPAFEAALHVGARLAGPTDDYAKPLKLFARNLGVAFQILNDLKDWRGDTDNKLAKGGDVLGGRPTVLWALALEGLNEAQQSELCELVESLKAHASADELTAGDQATIQNQLRRVRHLYQEASVFEKAERLIDKHRQRAEEVADSVDPEEFRRLLYYLVDTVLDDTEEVTPTIDIVEPTGLNRLPIVSGPASPSLRVPSDSGE